MNSSTSWLIRLIFLLPLAAAGQEEGKPPAPKPPFLAPIPDNTITTVEVTSQSPAGKMPPGYKKVNKIIQVKFGPTRELISIWSDGSETQVWYTNGYRLEKVPGNAPIMVTPAPGGSGGADADFSILNWLDESNYVGIESQDGKDCYHFKVRLKLKDPPIVVDNSAYINIKTKWPVTWDIGPNHLKLDSIEDRKTREPLVLPEDFARQLKAYHLAASMTNAYRKQ